MSNQYNTITIEGNLVSDPEMRATGNGTPIANFTVANNRSYKLKGSEEWQKETAYVEVKAWAGNATKVANQLRKGSTILLWGRLSQESWEDKTTKAKRTKLYITMDDFRVIEKQQRQERPAESGATASAQPQPDDGDQAPF